MLVDDLAKINRLSRNAMFAALIVIAAIAIYNWIVAPHTSYLLAAQHHHSVVKNMSKKSRVISNTVEVRKKNLEELQEKFSILRSTLFTTKQAKEFFSDLQIICEETGCAMYSLNLSANETKSQSKKSVDKPDIAPESAILRVTGVYGNIIGLIERLLERSQKVWIDSIKIKTLGVDTSQVRCIIKITRYTIRNKEAHRL